jgi:leucyl/phenylalanyl-tRNA---protein transferase
LNRFNCNVKAAVLGAGGWQTALVESRVVPTPSHWAFPCTAEAQAELAGTGEVIGIGADLQPGTLLAAYRCGLFPMPVGNKLAWWSPDPRGVVPLDGLVVSRSLRRSCQRYRIRVSTAFEDVITACASPSRKGAWINKKMKSAYVQLHQLGWAQSVEAWAPDGVLAGGLYGLAIGGLFAGESMFYRQRDASKVALVGLVEGLRAGGGHLLDVQWLTPHLASLGAIAISRARYHDLLNQAVDRPQLCLGGPAVEVAGD